MKWYRDGILKINSEWNRERKIKFTMQDPCNIIRKSMGDKTAEDIREFIRALVGEENFVDMVPNKSNNYCCGGGGGSLQAGHTKERRKYGKLKFDQIMTTGADYVLAPCHNCHSQIEDICEHYGGNYHTAHIWTIICLSLGVLGKNERSYLGPDLWDVGL